MTMQINNTYKECSSFTGTVENCGDKSVNVVSKEQYLNQLSKKFPDVNLIEGTYRQGTMFGPKGQCNIMISPVILGKMSRDPEVASKIEQIIKDIPREEQIFRAKCSSAGMNVVSSGTIIDANGGVSGYCFTTRKSEGTSDNRKKDKTEATKSYRLNQKRKADEELQKAIRKNLEEKIQEQKALQQYNSSQLYVPNSYKFFKQE
ncbi:hypothetical protein EHE19_005990 [Ruminiclostridium herbifermentans]|uniref:Uncharacterized protein n=1 Tax=Ruminiclostridium herbifermentans TaxID=2488810 RepID=A0A4V6EQF3_9FIRM|nr:DUF6033 family protein [Ruminiclostridium herbifermentans]QNU67992.1 hypothetical protein EHE19_005990 [Ruminiclostridium herbifermentans]